MTASTDLLTDGFGRVREAVHEAVSGLDPEELAARLDPALGCWPGPRWSPSRAGRCRRRLR